MLEMFFFINIVQFFYDSQILQLFFNNCMDDIYIAWRIAICKIWRVPWTNLCNLLPYLASVMDPELWFSKRCIKFIKMALNSDNIIVRTIINSVGNQLQFHVWWLIATKWLMIDYNRSVMDIKNLMRFFYTLEVLWNNSCYLLLSNTSAHELLKYYVLKL